MRVFVCVKGRVNEGGKYIAKVHQAPVLVSSRICMILPQQHLVRPVKT